MLEACYGGYSFVGIYLPVGLWVGEVRRIPMKIVHKFPTTLLHSLEGLHELVDWEELLKLLSQDGSFLNSPAATACALMYTKDERCLAYVEKILDRFGNAGEHIVTWPTGSSYNSIRSSWNCVSHLVMIMINAICRLWLLCWKPCKIIFASSDCFGFCSSRLKLTSLVRVPVSSNNSSLHFSHSIIKVNGHNWQSTVPVVWVN